MPSQIGTVLETRRPLADAVHQADRILMPMLHERSPSAKAFWDAGQDQQGREVLTLALTDPWADVATDFTPEDLTNNERLRQRFSELISEMVAPRRQQGQRERVEIRDTFITASQLEQFRLRLGNIPDISRAGLRFHNQARILPNQPEHYLLADFAVEVNAPFAEAVRNIVRESGLQIRQDPWLIKRPGVREALLRLVEQHRQDAQSAPELAVCFRLQDRQTIHLLEISSGAPEVGDESLEGVGFSARGVLPHVGSLKIYLTHPNDLRVAFAANRDHPFFHDLRDHNCDFLLPDDQGTAFRRDFPDLLET